MRHLEDIIKKRLEDYESKLPESDMSEFKAMLDKSKTTRRQKKASYVWWVLTAAAACLTLFVTIDDNPEPATVSRVEQSLVMAETTEPTDSDPVTTGIISQTTASVSHPAREINEQAASEDVTKTLLSVMESVTEDEFPRETDRSEQNNEEHSLDTAVTGDDLKTSSFTAEIEPGCRRTPHISIGKLAAGILGGSGAIALAGVLSSSQASELLAGSDDSSDALGGDGMDGIGSESSWDKKIGDVTHSMPLRVGLSLRYPFSNRWSLTTGLDYSLYSSETEFSLSGIHRQKAHYLGLPLRADYTITRNRWMDVYLGAGASVDVCIAANEDGMQLNKDGVRFSLMTAGGVQFNITRSLGLYLEPTLSWNIPPSGNTLDTYRSKHPLMFSLSTGFRITLNGRD